MPSLQELLEVLWSGCACRTQHTHHNARVVCHIVERDTINAPCWLLERGFPFTAARRSQRRCHPCPLRRVCHSSSSSLSCDDVMPMMLCKTGQPLSRWWMRKMQFFLSYLWAKIGIPTVGGRARVNKCVRQSVGLRQSEWVRPSRRMAVGRPLCADPHPARPDLIHLYHDFHVSELRGPSSVLLRTQH